MKMKLVAPPLYVLTTNTLDKNQVGTHLVSGEVGSHPVLRTVENVCASIRRHFQTRPRCLQLCYLSMRLFTTSCRAWRC